MALMRRLSDIGKEMWIRRVLVPGLTDDAGDLRRTAEFVAGLKTVSKVEILPYHALGVPKWEKIGVKYTLGDAKSPTAEEMKAAKRIMGIR